MDSRPDTSQAGVQVGEILAGKYRVERVLGVGGMGVVIAAHHIALDEKVALKFLLPEALKNPEAVARFLREARASTRIKNEHVVSVRDVGELENGSPYMVMEYLEGGNLAAWLEQRGAMSGEQAVDFVLQACEAIAEAHALGIVHRDLKPANLFCIQRADGQLSVKVLDFGISKVTSAGAEGHDMTSTTAVVGSPSYMSPEQLQSSKGVDARADVWSLGVILFELLTARTPFAAETLTELIIQIAVAPAPDVRSLRPDTPAGLAQALATCLEKERTRRFADVGELARALEAFGSKRAHTSVERVVGTLRAAGIGLGQLASLSPQGMSAAAGTQSTWGTTNGPKRKTGLWVGLSAGAAVVLAVSVGGAMFARKGTSLPATLPAAAIIPSPSAFAPPATPSQGSLVPDPPPPLSAASAAAPLASSASPKAPAPPTPAGPRRTRPVRGGGAVATASTPAPNCNPNYTLDDEGQKHFKPECFQH